MTTVQTCRGVVGEGGRSAIANGSLPAKSMNWARKIIKNCKLETRATGVNRVEPGCGAVVVVIHVCDPGAVQVEPVQYDFEPPKPVEISTCVSCTPAKSSDSVSR